MSEVRTFTIHEIRDILGIGKRNILERNGEEFCFKNERAISMQLESARNKAKRRDPALFQSLTDRTFVGQYRYSLVQSLSIFEELARISQTRVRNRERIRAHGVTKDVVTKAELSLLKSAISK